MNGKLNIINDEPDPIPGQDKKEVNKTNNIVSKENKKSGRPSLLTPELFTKLIRLFEDHFFIAIVASKADIYRQNINNWQNEQEEFNLAISHAKDTWIAHKMSLLNKYAKDKREKDWRALKYLLSIADKEYSDNKWIKEGVEKDRLQQINITINQGDLTKSKAEAMRVIGSGSTKKETVSLVLFDKEDKPKEGKSQAT